MPRSKSLGWTASVDDGLRHIATVVVAADPAPPVDHARLLYFNRDAAEALDDPLNITVLSEDPLSDVFTGDCQQI